MRLVAAAIQMRSEAFDVAVNLDRADGLLRQASREGADLAVLPELFNTGYAARPDFGSLGEGVDGPTWSHLRKRSLEWGMSIAGGFVECDGQHLYDSLGIVGPDGEVHVYRKRNLVFWERFRFRRGCSPVVVPTRWGRVGLAICADMIYDGVWQHYRSRIDMAVVSAAWPDFADRVTGRKHWLLGHVGPLSGSIPGRVAVDLDIPVVFANQCGETRTLIPGLPAPIADRFAGGSSICDGRHGPPVVADAEERVLLSPITIHPQRGVKTWHFTSSSVPAA